VGSLKNLILKNYEARKAEFYMKAFWHGTKASWLYHGPPRVKWKWNMHIIFLHGPRLLRWSMWPMGLLFLELWRIHLEGWEVLTTLYSLFLTDRGVETWKFVQYVIFIWRCVYYGEERIQFWVMVDPRVVTSVKYKHVLSSFPGWPIEETWNFLQYFIAI
jgi:hypothetical protein